MRSRSILRNYQGVFLVGFKILDVTLLVVGGAMAHAAAVPAQPASGARPKRASARTRRASLVMNPSLLNPKLREATTLYDKITTTNEASLTSPHSV